MTTNEEDPRVDTVVRLLTGQTLDPDKVHAAGRMHLEEQLLGPVRRWRAANPGADVYQFGEVGQALISRTLKVGPSATEGLIYVLLEEILAGEQAAAPDVQDQPSAGRTGLDWEALIAERNRLAERLARSERLREKAEREGEHSAANENYLHNRIADLRRKAK